MSEENKIMVELMLRNYLASRNGPTEGFSIVNEVTNRPRYTNVSHRGGAAPKATTVLEKIKRIARKLIEEDRKHGRGMQDTELSMNDLLERKSGKENNIVVAQSRMVPFLSPLEREMRAPPDPSPVELPIETPKLVRTKTMPKKRLTRGKHTVGSLSERVKNL